MAADPRLLTAALIGNDALSAELGVVVPEDWPTSPGALAAALEFLHILPGQAQWSTYFFVHRPTQTLVGSGGFKGEPVDGSVEIGYEIASAWRGRGAATAAASAFVKLARESTKVDVINAQTAAGANASVAVLRKLGFKQMPSEPGELSAQSWRWQLSLSLPSESSGREAR